MPKQIQISKNTHVELSEDLQVFSEILGKLVQLDKVTIQKGTQNPTREVLEK